MIFEPRLSPGNIEQFRRFIYRFYEQEGRDFFWRTNPEPYMVLVSEIMLQQTQTERVEQKLPVFLNHFPTLESLAVAPLSSVLSQWVGLGYNRRAKNLHACAQIIIREYGGQIPADPGVLVGLPGIGAYSAGSITAFAYNVPSVFIETNIRRVFIYHFFLSQSLHDYQGGPISDKQLYPLIHQTLDRENPRLWYYALMDYGARLKSLVHNPNRRSASYARQSVFQGSNRQVRGAVLRVLTREKLVQKKYMTDLLSRDLGYRVPVEKTMDVVQDLVAEGFLEYSTLTGEVRIV